MKKVTFAQAMKNAGIPQPLANAVIRQLGATTPNNDEDDEASHTLENIAQHGIMGGYGGFVYYTDTNAFFAKNKALIVGLLEEQADQLGEDVQEMVFNFNCLKDVSEYRQLKAEIARAIYGKPGKDDYHNVPNALAWFAAEEVARAWSDRNEY